VVGEEEPKPENGDIPTMSYEEAAKNIERRGSKIEHVADNEDKPVNRLTNSGGQRKSVKLIKEEVKVEAAPVIEQQKPQKQQKKEKSGGGVFGFFSKICGTSKKSAEID